MSKKQTAWPFQEGYVLNGDGEVHVFTDYRWDDGSKVRQWHLEQKLVDFSQVTLRPFSLGASTKTDQ